MGRRRRTGRDLRKILEKSFASCASGDWDLARPDLDKMVSLSWDRGNGPFGAVILVGHVNEHWDQSVGLWPRPTRSRPLEQEREGPPWPIKSSSHFARKEVPVMLGKILKLL